MSHPGGRPRSVDPTDLDRAAVLRDLGLSWSQVSDLTGIARGTLSVRLGNLSTNSQDSTGRPRPPPNPSGAI
jgi:hypothetical protein